MRRKFNRSIILIEFRGLPVTKTIGVKRNEKLWHESLDFLKKDFIKILLLSSVREFFKKEFPMWIS